MCVCEFVVDCSCERIDDAESSFSANASFCSKCPDGFVCKSGLLVGQKKPKKSLGAGVIAAIVVGSVAACNTRDGSDFLNCNACFSYSLGVPLPSLQSVVHSGLSYFFSLQNFCAEIRWAACRGAAESVERRWQRAFTPLVASDLVVAQ